MFYNVGNRYWNDVLGYWRDLCGRNQMVSRRNNESCKRSKESYVVKACIYIRKSIKKLVKEKSRVCALPLTFLLLVF